MEYLKNQNPKSSFQKSLSFKPMTDGQVENCNSWRQKNICHWLLASAVQQLWAALFGSYPLGRGWDPMGRREECQVRRGIPLPASPHLLTCLTLLRSHTCLTLHNPDDGLPFKSPIYFLSRCQSHLTITGAGKATMSWRRRGVCAPQAARGPAGAHASGPWARHAGRVSETCSLGRAWARGPWFSSTLLQVLLKFS